MVPLAMGDSASPRGEPGPGAGRRSGDRREIDPVSL